MDEGRLGPGDCGRPRNRGGRRRGFVTVERELPRFVTSKEVAGRNRYYWTLPSYYRKLGFDQRTTRPLDTTRFQPPLQKGDQLALF